MNHGDTFIVSQAPDMTLTISNDVRDQDDLAYAGAVCLVLVLAMLERIHRRFNAPQYLNIFENVMLRSVRVRNPEGNLIFQQDNHPVHCSMYVQR